MELKEDEKEKEKMKEIFSRISEKEKIKSISKTLGSIICILANHLIHSLGYTTASTVISRDIRELGKRDVERLKEIFKLDEDLISKKRTTRLAGMLLGLELKLIREGDGKTHAYIVDCPFSSIVKGFNQPFICKICEEYNRGIVEKLFGSKFKLVSEKRMSQGDDYCKYHIREKD